MNAINPCLGPIGGDPADQPVSRRLDALDDDRDVANAIHTMIAGWKREFSNYLAAQIINNERAFCDVRREVPVALVDLLDLVRQADHILVTDGGDLF